MSATHTSRKTDSRKLMPSMRLCAIASQAAQSSRPPSTQRNWRGRRDQACGPALSASVPQTIQAAAGSHQPSAGGCPAQPSAIAATPAAPSSTPPASAAAKGIAFNRPHSQPAAATSTRVKAWKGQAAALNSAAAAARAARGP
jgi:hypothetical protein